MPNPTMTKQDKEVIEKAESFMKTSETEKGPKKPIAKLLWVMIPVVLLAIILLVLSTVFALVNRNSDTIVEGVYIKGVDVSGLTKEQAAKAVDQSLGASLGLDLILTHNGESIPISPADIYASFDIDGALELAYNIGRDDNIFQANYDIITAYFSHFDILPGFSYSPELLDEKLTQIEANLPDYVVQPSYSVEENELKIQKGKDGVLINKSDLVDSIVHALNNLESATKTVEIPTSFVTATPVNLDAIYQEVHKDAVDAYYTKDPFTVYPSSTGIDFKISLDEAKAMFAEPQEEYIIPLKVVYPAVSTNDIGSEAFPDKLAEYSTNFSTSNVNRSTNIRLATKKINGVVLMPGETFSYNATVGQRTIANGFKVAGVYSNGEVTEGVGGGICQVSSTLYNSVLLSNLDIVERKNHTFNTGYVPAGQDATVSWGAPDFKFKNNRNYAIRIVAWVSGGTVTVQIFGLKQDDDYEVKIKSSVTGSIPFKTTYKTDSNLAPGEEKVVQKGSNGLRSVTYRILYKDGVEVSRTQISSDVYQPHNKIIARGA